MIDNFNSNSQANQDLFAYYICNTNNGYFLDLGCNRPIEWGNNTYNLELKGWSGLNIDIQDFFYDFKNQRKTPFILANLIEVNLNEILKSNNVPKVIDYLSLDIDDATEYFLFNNFPNDYEFKCITFEHDSYRIGNELKEKSRIFFIEKGYTLLCKDVSVNIGDKELIFEDWWINEKYIDIKKFNSISCYNRNNKEIKENILKNQTICLLTTCKNEEEILPFFLDYYFNFIGVNKIVVYDGGSTDKSIEIIKNFGADLFIKNSDFLDEDDLTFFRNEEWKKYKNDYDWIIVCTSDEFLYHPNLKEKLKEYKDIGISLPKVEGFDMISIEHPKYEKGKYIFEKIRRGIKDSLFLNKNVIFDPKKINDINYSKGAHRSYPNGDVRMTDNFDLKLLHYKWLSYEYLINDCKNELDRINKTSEIQGIGSHYKIFSEKTLDEYNNRFKRSVNILDGEISNLPYGYDHLIDYTRILVSDKIEIIHDIDAELNNMKIIIKNINENIIYGIINNFSHAIYPWLLPDDKSYLNGFYVEIYDEYDNLIYRSKLIIPT